MEIAIHQSLAVPFGILGNIMSFMVYLAPLPTFYRVYKKKTTEGFQSIPYVVALFSAMLWLYYGILKGNKGYLLISSNTLGCVIEGTYIIVYMFYAPQKAKIFTLKLLILMNVVAFGLIFLTTFLLTMGAKRILILGWICSAFAISVFAAPLSIMRMVIKTKSVEFMPVPLSLFLTLSAVIWFLYGFLIVDYFVAVPNVLGFLFGVAQMVLYVLYRGAKKVEFDRQTLPELVGDFKLRTLEKTEVHPINNETACKETNDQSYV